MHIYLLGDKIDSIKESTETSTNASREGGQDINIEKTKYMLTHHQIAGQHCNIKRADRSSENVSQFKYLRTTVTCQNLIQKKIKRQLNSSNACYHSVQKLVSSHLLSKNTYIQYTIL
jgi:hypothetical protein